MTRGGYGFDPFGRHAFGNRTSVVEPRYELSLPIDGRHNVPLDQVLKFTTYCYSSYLDPEDTQIYISEDGGGMYALAFDGQTFLSPYSGRVRRPDGQRLSYYIERNSPWPRNKKIVIRLEGIDDFGNVVSKDVPMKWSD